MSGSIQDEGPRPQGDFLTWEEMKDLGFFEEAPENMGPADDEEASDE
jgi:hypothetical protein